jgi:hypothetical protein
LGSHFGAVPSSDLAGIGLYLVAAISAPYDQPHPDRGSASERYRSTGFIGWPTERGKLAS